jgi:predicted enzyme related to lactoylglutathione lyase
MKLGEVCLHTNDVCRLANFYKELLHVENNSDDEVHQFILREETTLTIYNDGTTKNTGNNISLAFTVEDVDQEYQRLLDMGVTIIDKPTTQPWRTRNLHFLDPEGNHIYFRAFLK